LGIVSGVKPEGNYLGQDCTGIARRVGVDVRHIKPGDRVMSWTMKAFSTRFITPSRYCVRIPDSLSFEDAATMALVYITVFESLQHIGRLEAGQVSSPTKSHTWSFSIGNYADTF
jgi:NADPH:quinone reductase-like Zn-dependent oxidoreductase